MKNYSFFLLELYWIVLNWNCSHWLFQAVRCIISGGCFVLACTLSSLSLIFSSMWLPGGEDGLPLWTNISQISVCHWWILQNEERGMLQESSVVLSAFYCDFEFVNQLTYFPLVSLCQREEEGNHLSKGAERTFDQLQFQEGKDKPITMTDQSQVFTTHPDVTYQIENENQVPSSTIRVPATITAT